MIKIDYSKEEINRFELFDIIFSNNIQFYNLLQLSYLETFINNKELIYTFDINLIRIFSFLKKRKME